MLGSTSRIVGIGLACLLLGTVGAAEAVEEKREKPAAHVTAKQRDEAIRKAIAYLDKTVFALPNATGTPRKQFTVATSGLVWILAQDAQSKTARKAGTQIKKARAYLRAYIAETAKKTADPANLPETSGQVSSKHAMQYTWPLAMAGLFVGEAHARGLGTGTARKTLRQIVDVLEAAQAPNGGWGHGQVRTRGKARGPSVMDGFGGYPDTLQATSNLVAGFLAAIQPVAKPKKKETLPKATAYFEYAELSNGNFPYDPSQRASHLALTGVSRAAGAAWAMRLLGADWDDIGVERALEYIDTHFAYLSEGHGSSTLNLLLAAFLQQARGPTHWARFKEVFFPRIVALQAKDGHFDCVCQNKAFGSTNDSKPLGGKSAGMPGAFARGTDAYVTSIHTLILLLDRTAPKVIPKQKPAPARSKPITPR